MIDQELDSDLKAVIDQVEEKFKIAISDNDPMVAAIYIQNFFLEKNIERLNQNYQEFQCRALKGLDHAINRFVEDTKNVTSKSILESVQQREQDKGQIFDLDRKMTTILAEAENISLNMKVLILVNSILIVSATFWIFYSP